MCCYEGITPSVGGSRCVGMKILVGGVGGSRCVVMKLG